MAEGDLFVETLKASGRLWSPPEQPSIVAEVAGEQIAFWDALEWGVFYRSDCLMRTYVSPETWETLSYSEEALVEFFEATQEGSGMKRMVTDAGRFREAALREAAEKGIDVPQAKDTLTNLEERASALLVQAASLNAGATPLQLETFALRLGELRSDFRALEDRVGHLRGVIDLAEVAVLDTAS